MADEIKIYCAVVAKKGNVNVNSASGLSTNVDVDMGGDDAGQQTQDIAITDAALAIPASVTTVGSLYIENLDATNFLELSTGTGAGFDAARFAKIPAGLRMLLLPFSWTIYARANTAGVKVLTQVIEGPITA